MSHETAAMPPRKNKRDDLAVKVDKEVIRMARIISAIEDVSLAELLSETLRPIYEKKLEDYKRRGFDLKSGK